MSYFYKLFVLLILLFQTFIAFGSEQLAVVEQTAGMMSIYNIATHQALCNVKIGFLPHEIAISKDQRTAYISNFGLQDYDETIGTPGTNISVIDLINCKEQFRLATDAIDTAPHGVKLRPPFEKQLFVNTEKRGNLLVFDVNTHRLMAHYPIDSRTHNLLFSADGRVLWLIAGADGIIQINPDTGQVMRRIHLSTPARGLVYTPDHRFLLASGLDTISFINPNNLQIVKTFSHFKANQLLYSAMTPDQKLIVAPDVWHNQVLIINAHSGQLIKRLNTGINPVTVKIEPQGNFAYVTNARSDYISKINLKTYAIEKIKTQAGPNGLMILNDSRS